MPERPNSKAHMAVKPMTLRMAGRARTVHSIMAIMALAAASMRRHSTALKALSTPAVATRVLKNMFLLVWPCCGGGRNDDSWG